MCNECTDVLRHAYAPLRAPRRRLLVPYVTLALQNAARSRLLQLGPQLLAFVVLVVPENSHSKSGVETLRWTKC